MGLHTSKINQINKMYTTKTNNLCFKQKLITKNNRAVILIIIIAFNKYNNNKMIITIILTVCNILILNKNN